MPNTRKKMIFLMSQRNIKNTFSFSLTTNAKMKYTFLLRGRKLM